MAAECAQEVRAEQVVSCSVGTLIQQSLVGFPFTLNLVGSGEKGLNCGKPYASHICNNPECGKVYYRRSRCKNKACPDCYGRWIALERDRIMSRLDVGISLHPDKRLVAVDISPDPTKVDPDASRIELNALIQEGYRYATSKGVLGGAALFHPWRTTKEADEASIKANLHVWDWIRSQIGLVDITAFYDYSPHLHLICFVDWLTPPEEKEGWIYKTKEIKGAGGKWHVQDFRGDPGNLEKYLEYLLGHTGYVEEGHFESVRWFGSCSRIKFKTELVKEKLEPEIHNCKICGADLEEFWRWCRINYFYFMRGEITPNFGDEIEAAHNGEDPPPDVEKWLVTDLGEVLI